MRLSRLTALPHLRFLSVCLLGATSLFSLPATAEDGKVFFCPPAVVTGLSKPTNGIMYDADRCYDSQSNMLSAEQKAFLLSSGLCRYLTTQEVASYWKKPVAAGMQRVKN